MSTGITHNRATIHWTVPRIAYTPENYTVHFGTSRDSLTPFSQQLHSGNNFTAANLQFSVQLTELSAGTTYYYQVVAVNSVGSAASAEQSFTTTELRMLTKVIPKYLSVYVYTYVICKRNSLIGVSVQIPLAFTVKYANRNQPNTGIPLKDVITTYLQVHSLISWWINYNTYFICWSFYNKIDVRINSWT